MFPIVSIDGEQQEIFDDVERVLVEIPEQGETDRCTACNEPLTKDSDTYSGGPEGSLCLENVLDEPDEDGNEYGPHTPEPIPLSWLNSAGIHLDASEDSVTVTISVGDPRGAFAFTVRRIPADADNDIAGRLIMHTPYPGEGSPHMPTKELHPGTLLIGN